MNSKEVKDKMPKAGSAKMRPRARLIGLIGDELISDEPVALVELVKNAYDADARNVLVKFEGNDLENPDQIIVEDDGTGMDLETVLEGWFEPGTNIKRRKKASDGGRILQGAKGIGRFATARLARNLVLESKKEGDKEGVYVVFEWGRFDDESYLDEVSIEYEMRPIQELKHGTRLRLDGLRKTWEEDDYEELHSRLSRLISPFQEVIDFIIYLEIPAHSDLSGEVISPEFLLKPRYLLRGNLGKDGNFEGKFSFQSKPLERIKIPKLGGEDAKVFCGPFDVEIRAWDRDREGLEPLAKQFKKGVGQIRKVLDTYCGVSIYRDGFRVYPYGQRGNDWLNLDNRSRQNPTMSLANNQIIAAIRISREQNPKLKDRSTREGMVLNEAHSSLERWFIYVLALLEGKRYDLRPRREPLMKLEPLFEAFDLSEPVHQAKKELGKTHPVTISISNAEKQVKEGVERVQEVFSRLLLSAGLGHMIDVVIHEIGAPLGKVNKQLAVLEKDLKEMLTDKDMKTVSSEINAIKGWLEQIHTLRDRLDPQTPAKRGKTQTFDVIDEIRDNFGLFEALLEKQGIKFEIKYHEQIKVRMPRAGLGQILANLIDNSIYWLIREKGAGKGGHIQVKVDPLEHGFRILFSDDGLSVPIENREKIFEAYYTTKPTGMGLGLYIARLVIEPYGKLVYRDDCELPGACFEAIFERGVGR